MRPSRCVWARNGHGRRLCLIPWFERQCVTPPAHRPPQVLDSASAFASGRVAPTEVVREAARLRRLGFVGAIAQLFRRGGGEAQGVSVTVQLGSAEAARTELADAHATMKAAVRPPEKVVPFAVPGIPALCARRR